MENVQANQCVTPRNSKYGEESTPTVRSIEEIPEKYRHIFHGYKSFNLVQSKVFDDVLHTNKSIIISAPTGSGKTAVFELAIIKFLMNQSEGSNFKIVYVAPIKALCSEKYLDWSKKLTPLGVPCREATGDTDFGDLSELEHTCLVITTPEKWDSLTRKWRDYEDVFGLISLFLIDEVHLLSEDIRGPILETIVSRMRTIQFSMKLKEKTRLPLRFVAASATIPNIEDLAIWLGRNSEDNVSYFRISDENRPVPLEKFILGFSSNSGGFKFDMSLNYKLAGIVRKYSMGKPSLIFCSSRKSVEMASAELFKNSPVILSDNRKAALITLSKKLHDSKLQNLVLKGISYHHAGLGHDDRNIIEEAFRISLLLILVSTSTLAMGVNLPAHLVIIKSTAAFIRGKAEEYKESALLQMIGRAGRPQYDTKGVAVIMTEQKNVKKYENLMNGRTPVESHLHKHLAEHLNSEIVLQTITDLEVAMEWIRSTYLYVRAVKSPVTYGFAAGMTRETVEKKLEEICLLQLNALETQGLIVKDPALGLSVLATHYGRLMARYYLSFDTMKVFRKIRGDETYLEVFNTIISCKEFSEFTLRVSDKKTLNSLNAKCTHFPIKGKIKSVYDKISCLIQAVLGNIPIQESSLTLDALKMTRLGERIAKCLVEYIRISYKSSNAKQFQALLNSVIIAKCLKARMWQDSEFVCKQLKKIGTVFSSLLINAGKKTLKSLEETTTGELEMILGKTPPFGNEIHEGLSAFPAYEVTLKLLDSESVQIVVNQIKSTFNYDGKNSTLIMGDSENNLILFYDKVDAVISERGIFEKVAKIPVASAHSINAHLIHESLVGVDKSTVLTLNVIEPSDNNKNTGKKAQSTSRVTRSRSNKKPNKAPKSVQKITTPKTTTTEQYNKFFENMECFENIDEIEALYDSKGGPNFESNGDGSKNPHKYETDKKPLQQKLHNFTYTEKPKMHLQTDDEDNILEMFEDDFEDTIKELEGNISRHSGMSDEAAILMSDESNFPPNQDIQKTSISDADNLKNCEKKQKLISDFFLKRKGIATSAQCKNKQQISEKAIKIITPLKKTNNAAIQSSNEHMNGRDQVILITSQPQPTVSRENRNEMRGGMTNTELQLRVQYADHAAWENSRQTNKLVVSPKKMSEGIERQPEKSKNINLKISSPANNVFFVQNKFPVSTGPKYTATSRNQNYAESADNNNLPLKRECIAINRNAPKTVENNMSLNMVLGYSDTTALCTQPLNLCAKDNYPVDLSKQHSLEVVARDYIASQHTDSKYSSSTHHEEPLSLIKRKQNTQKSADTNLGDFRQISIYYELENVFTNDNSRESTKCPFQVNFNKPNQLLPRKELLQLSEREETHECTLPNKQRRILADKDTPNISQEITKNYFMENLPNFDSELDVLIRDFRSDKNESTASISNPTQFEDNEINSLFSFQTQKKPNLSNIFDDSLKPSNSQGIKENWKFQSFSDWLFCKSPPKPSTSDSNDSCKENSTSSPLFDNNEDTQFRKSLAMKPLNIFGPVNDPNKKSTFFKGRSNFEIQKANLQHHTNINEVISTSNKGSIREKLDHNQSKFGAQTESLKKPKDQAIWKTKNYGTDRTKNTVTGQQSGADNFKIFTNAPSIDKIVVTLSKHHKFLEVLDILQIIVDSRLSKDVKTPLTLNDLDINYLNENQENNSLKPKDINFLTDNEEDKEDMLTNSAKPLKKPTSGSIVRQPEVKPEKSNNDNIKQNPAQGLLSICLKSLTRPHNLYKSKMLRRQKAFLVPKPKQSDRINLRKGVCEELFSAAVKQEIKEVLNGAEERMEGQVKELHSEFGFETENICDLYEEDNLDSNMYQQCAEVDFDDGLLARSPFGVDPFFEEQSTLFDDVPISEGSSSSHHCSYDDFFTSFSQRSGQGYDFLGTREDYV